MVFSSLLPLVIEDVTDEGGVIHVRARTPGGPVAYPGCGTGTARVHGYHERVVADVKACPCSADTLRRNKYGEQTS